MSVAYVVDSEAAQHIDEFCPVDIAEDGAVVIPLYGSVVGAHRLAVLQKAGVDMVLPVLDRLFNDLLSFTFSKLFLADQLQHFSRLLLGSIEVLTHFLSSCLK